MNYLIILNAISLETDIAISSLFIRSKPFFAIKNNFFKQLKLVFKTFFDLQIFELRFSYLWGISDSFIGENKMVFERLNKSDGFYVVVIRNSKNYFTHKRIINKS
jgi:hypothetical protein